jgi:glycosyltransferase involved in cell wall biosynthesis
MARNKLAGVQTPAPPELSVVIPAYNEAEHIYANLIEVCQTLADADCEIILVDDGSQDATSEEARRAQADGCPIKTLRLETNQGKGRALYAGAGYASGEIIGFLDADLEVAPGYMRHLLRKMEASGADVMIGTKSTMDSPFPAHRRWLSKLYRALVVFLFGLSIRDTQTGIKLFRREVLSQAIPRLSVSRFAFDVELLIAATRLGYTILEEPVQVTYRRKQVSSRISLRHMLGMFIDTMAIYYRASFWKWLQPGLGTRLWMLAFMLGVFMFGIGVGKLITPLTLKPPIKQIFSIIALQFLPLTLRDWLLVIAGGLLSVLSLVILNRRILDAFANRDKGDFQGILRRR